MYCIKLLLLCQALFFKLKSLHFDYSYTIDENLIKVYHNLNGILGWILVNMKSIFNKKIILSLVAAIFLFSQINSFKVGAKVGPVATDLKLIDSITFASSSESPTDEETTNAQSLLKSISQAAYDAFTMDNPKNSMWMDINSSEVKISPKGFYNGSKYIWRITSLTNVIFPLPIYSDALSPHEITSELDAIINGFTPSGSTMLEQIKSIHDYICEINVYDSKATHKYNAYGALVDNRSVCEGYAEAFKLLCDKNGIECILVFGKGITSSAIENHMWNYVKMDDGKWYAVDVTWDDKKSSYTSEYLLVGSSTAVIPDSNTLFSGNHIPSGNISDTNYKTFILPELSSNSYLENNPLVSENETDVSDTGEFSNSRTNASFQPNRYYYNQLNIEQKNFYNMLLSVSPPKDDAVSDITETSDLLIDTNAVSESNGLSEVTESTETSFSENVATDNFVITIVGQQIENTTPITSPSVDGSSTAVSFFKSFVIVLSILSIMVIISFIIIKFQKGSNN